MKEALIVGGGISGLACGESLSRAGYRVTIVEREGTVGGLARSFALEKTWLPITYHHVMLPDTTTRAFIKKHGFEHKLAWIRSSQAFWYDGTPYLLSQPHHLLSFAPLALRDKLRLFYLGLYVWGKKDWGSLKTVNCKDWLERVAGPNVTGLIFQNLMNIKFGMPLASVSAAWLGSRMNQSVRNHDKYGYLATGWQPLFETMAREIVKNNGRIITNFEVTSLSPQRVEGKTADGRTESYAGDFAVSTLPPFLLASLLKPDGKLESALTRVRYKSFISFICASPKKLSSQYWSVVLKPSLIFGGFFNHTVLSPSSSTDGDNIYYFFTYLDNDDPLLAASEESLTDLYVRDIRKLFGDFSLTWSKVFKLKYSQPVFTSDYDNLPIEIAKDLYLAGVYRQYPRPRTMDAAFISGCETARYIIDTYADT